MIERLGPASMFTFEWQDTSRCWQSEAIRLQVVAN